MGAHDLLAKRVEAGRCEMEGRAVRVKELRGRRARRVYLRLEWALGDWAIGRLGVLRSKPKVRGLPLHETRCVARCPWDQSWIGADEGASLMEFA